MSDAPAESCRRVLDDARAAGGTISREAAATLGAAPADTLDAVLREFADAHGAGALAVLIALGGTAHGGVRRASRRALYRLSQRGISPAPVAQKPVVERQAEKVARAWVSAVDGTGSRATWILFDGAYGGHELCSLIVSDTAGILEAAGGEITKKRLDAELTALREAQRLPWLETSPATAMALVAEALALHQALGIKVPGKFARWHRLFDGIAPPAAPEPPAQPDGALVARGGELLEEPEMAGWFFEPADAELTEIAERELGDDARRRWTRRLMEQAVVFDATGRAPTAALARAVAGSLAKPGAATEPFAHALAKRAVEVAKEVAAGRVSAADATRAPMRAHA
jgi:hypothetical protein